jgi:hypothetical protein
MASTIIYIFDSIQSTHRFQQLSNKELYGVSSNPAHGEVYSTHHYYIVIKFVSDLRQVRWFSPGTPVSSTDKTDRNDIAEILLKGRTTP